MVFGIGIFFVPTKSRIEISKKKGKILKYITFQEFDIIFEEIGQFHEKENCCYIFLNILLLHKASQTLDILLKYSKKIPKSRHFWNFFPKFRKLDFEYEF